MPNLNNFFRRLRDYNVERAEKHQQRKQPLQTLSINTIDLSSNLSSSARMSRNGIVGCCSRKTSSTLSRGENHPPPNSRLHLPINNRKNSSASTAAKLSNNFIAEQRLLPDSILFRIFDSIQSPFDLLRLRHLNKSIAEYCRSKIQRVVELDLRRVKFETLSSASANSSSSSNQQPETSIIIGSELWHVHPSGYKVLCRVVTANDEQQLSNKKTKNAGMTKSDDDKIEENLPQFRLEVLVDEQWTSREIVVLCSLVNAFRHVRRIDLDAPIFELIVANLAAIDLDRWFAYQCFVKAWDDGGQMNLALNKLAAQLQQDELMATADSSDPDKLYWPNAIIIQIRTTERESITLARVLNYGVRSNLLIDRQRLDRLSIQVCVKEANKERPKQLVRNLYHFRCWVGSLGFDERFSQHWRVRSNVV